MTLNLFDIEQELVVFLRNQDIFSISDRGVTTETETQSGNGTKTDFDLAHTNIKNVRSVTVDSSLLSFGTDYLAIYEGTNQGRVSLTNPANNDTDNVVIVYDYGDTDKIFSEWPKANVKIADYPLISVGLTSTVTEKLGFRGEGNKTDAKVSVTLFAETTKEVNDLTYSVRSAFMQNKQTFYYFTHIEIGSLSPMIDSDKNEEIVQRTHDFEIQTIVEIV